MSDKSDKSDKKKTNGNGHEAAGTKSKSEVTAEKKKLFAEYDTVEAELEAAEKVVTQNRDRLRHVTEKIYHLCGNEKAFLWGNRTAPMILVVKPITKGETGPDGKVTRVEIGKTYYFRGPQTRDVERIPG